MGEQDGTSFVEGLFHRKAGEGIETVTMKSGVFRLLLSELQLEVIEGSLLPDKFISVEPFPDGAGDAVETYYILSGSLRAEHEGRVLEVLPGEALIAKDLKAPAIFVAQEDVRFLYVTSRPSFHQISKKLRELMGLAVEVEVKDGYTAEHCLRIQQFSFATGSLLNLSHARLLNLAYGAYLHDVGKVKVPESILSKPGPLTPDEWVMMKRHPTFGREMLENTSISRAGPIVEQHHERSDGSGYPLGLSGSQVLTESSIVAVVDTFDAMTTDRPYRKGSSPERAYLELRKYAGEHYPKDVVEAFIESNMHENISNSIK